MLEKYTWKFCVFCSLFQSEIYKLGWFWLFYLHTMIPAGYTLVKYDNMRSLHPQTFTHQNYWNNTVKPFNFTSKIFQVSHVKRMFVTFKFRATSARYYTITYTFDVRDLLFSRVLKFIKSAKLKGPQKLRALQFLLLCHDHKNCLKGSIQTLDSNNLIIKKYEYNTDKIKYGNMLWSYSALSCTCMIYSAMIQYTIQ